MATNPVNLQSINEQNQSFWLEQAELLLRRIDDEELVQSANIVMECDAIIYPF
jgi:hypothetical protein